MLNSSTVLMQPIIYHFQGVGECESAAFRVQDVFQPVGYIPNCHLRQKVFEIVERA